MKDVIQKRMEKYSPKSSEEELNALKEITQEVALYSLYKAGFFQEACFLGGTSLRIVHGMDRFSEDLDFSTFEKNEKFNLDDYLDKAVTYMNAYGYDLSVNAKDLSDKIVQSRFLKDDSIKNILTFKYSQDSRAKIKIKVEIDTNPPKGATHKIDYIDFPTDFPVSIYDLPSLMSGKLHALLCRPYPKGRDWYDFLWYVSHGVRPNLNLLSNALFQLGPWKGDKKKVTPEFVKTILNERIKELNWKDVALDVRKFLPAEKAESVGLWSEEFFLSKLKKMEFDHV